MGNVNEKKKLLYVDDDLLSLESIQKLLRYEYDIDTASNVEKTLELVDRNNYDAILMDIGLIGDIDGIELTKMIKQRGNYKKIPVIALTAYASRKDREYFLNHGLDYYIAKPFFKKDILKLLDEVFNSESEAKTNSE